MKLPEHKASLTLTHNDHLDVYEKLEEKLQDDYYKDMGPEDRAECLRTNSLWTLHWYPRTPVSFYVVHGPTLERVLELAAAIESEGNLRAKDSTETGAGN